MSATTLTAVFVFGLLAVPAHYWALRRPWSALGATFAIVAIATLFGGEP